MAVNGIDPTTFNPNAGREEAYNNRWQKYLTNLGQTQNKINVKKARKYFDQQFEQDWNNEAASREIDFISQKAKQNQQNLINKWRQEREAAELASQEQDATDFTNAGYIMNSEGNWIKPELPKTSPTSKSPIRPATDWNAVAASKLGTGKTTADVTRLQKYMAGLGIDIGKNGADGMWGDDTQKAFDRFQGYEQFRGSEWDNITGTATPPLVQPNGVPSQKPSPEVKQEVKQPDWRIGMLDDKNKLHVDNTKWRRRHLWDDTWNYRGNTYEIYVNKGDGETYLVDMKNGKIMKARENGFGRIDDEFTQWEIDNNKNIWSPITKETGLFKAFRVGGIIKQILKNSNVFPYNLQ